MSCVKPPKEAQCPK